MNKATLEQRLQQIALSLSKHDHALALLGLGSVGVETARMDEYSDLDFFAIVEKGYKTEFLQDLTWLSDICPIAYHFANTADGYKLLYADGIFCEMAIFELDELAQASYAPGRILWKRPQIPAEIAFPTIKNSPVHHESQWLIGEALTNLYVGMARDLRGEKLSAMRFIQYYAVDRLVELVGLIEPAQGQFKDEFSAERRFEFRHPLTSTQLASWMQGYAHNRESALAILEFLEQHFKINPAMNQAIRDYCHNS